MSMRCQVVRPQQLLKSLAVLNISKDSWALMEFMEKSVELYVESPDRGCTAVAVLPQSLFSNYTSSGVRFSVHLGMLSSALMLGGQGLLPSAGHMHIELVYPTDEARLLVEITDGNVVLRSKLLTQRVMGMQLNLHFSNTRIVNEVMLLGDAARSAIEDLVMAQCLHTVVELDPEKGVTLRGEGGPYSTVVVHIPNDSDAILPTSNRRERAQTRVLQSHLALVCGVRMGTKVWRNTSTSGLDLAGALSVNPGSGSGLPQPTFGGFERLLLQINEARQLNVVHMTRDKEVPVTVTLVTSAMFDLDDM
uniref:Cell cycle checkpoint protein RAD1-like n=1 Tax=Trypanosoma congolense (strain IL3000) TaxID=1068625 RepID=G0UIU3_TRYCI|nr:conserved hypothetical protein [Trypanosoma congolense IL3000]